LASRCVIGTSLFYSFLASARFFGADAGRSVSATIVQDTAQVPCSEPRTAALELALAFVDSQSCVLHAGGWCKQVRLGLRGLEARGNLGASPQRFSAACIASHRSPAPVARCLREFGDGKGALGGRTRRPSGLNFSCGSSPALLFPSHGQRERGTAIWLLRSLSAQGAPTSAVCIAAAFGAS